MLPTIKTYIFQPNCLTEANYHCTLIQERLINAVIFGLQEAIQKRMHGENYIQLSLFEPRNLPFISIEIQLNEIAQPAQYRFVKEAIKKLASIVVELRYRNEVKKENRIRLVGLFRADIPEEGKRSSTIIIDIDKMVAKKLIEIDLNEQGKPINYTKFIYQIAIKSRIKYTPRIYKLLCSWRKSGQFIMSLDDFRKFLGIEKKYNFYRDIKRNILLPVQRELIDINADCWFDCEANDFEIRDGNTVTKLFFRVITTKFMEDEEKRKDYIKHILQSYHSFKERDFQQIKGVFEHPNMSEVIMKIGYLNDYVRNPNIIHKKKYIIDALLNEFITS